MKFRGMRRFWLWTTGWIIVPLTQPERVLFGEEWDGRRAVFREDEIQRTFYFYISSDIYFAGLWLGTVYITHLTSNLCSIH